MALTFIHKKKNRRTFSGKAAVWVSFNDGAAWTRVTESAELTIEPETSEDELVNNRGHGRYDAVTKNYNVAMNFIERGEDVRQMWTDDTDQAMRGVECALWIQGAQLLDTSDADVAEHWCFPFAQLKPGFGSYQVGGASPIFAAEFYCEANDTCADVVITAPTGEDCYKGAAAATATISDGEFMDTFDSLIPS